MLVNLKHKKFDSWNLSRDLILIVNMVENPTLQLYKEFNGSTTL